MRSLHLSFIDLTHSLGSIEGNLDRRMNLQRARTLCEVMITLLIIIDQTSWKVLIDFLFPFNRGKESLQNDFSFCHCSEPNAPSILDFWHYVRHCRTFRTKDEMLPIEFVWKINDFGEKFVRFLSITQIQASTDRNRLNLWTVSSFLSIQRNGRKIMIIFSLKAFVF